MRTYYFFESAKGELFEGDIQECIRAGDLMDKINEQKKTIMTTYRSE